MHRFRRLFSFFHSLQLSDPFRIAAKAYGEWIFSFVQAALDDEYEREAWNHDPWGAAHLHCDPATFEQ